MIDSCVRITLDVRETSMPVVVKAKQGDTGRRIHISLADGGMPYEISSDCYATFTANKPDNTKLYNDCTIINNVIEYIFTEQTCAAVGRAIAEIRLYGSDNKMVTSASFVLEVHGTVFSEGDVASDSELNALDSLVKETTALKNDLEDKLESGYFMGKQGPQGVPGDDYVLTDADKQEVVGMVLSTEEIAKISEEAQKSKLLVVTTGDDGLATHTPSEITKHFNNGGCVVYVNDDGNLAHLVTTDDSYSAFVLHFETANEAKPKYSIYNIQSNKAVIISSRETVSVEAMNSQITEAVTNGKAEAVEEVFSDERFSAVETAIADLKYTPIEITSFKPATTILEKGDTLTGISVEWKLNKVPVSAVFDGQDVSDIGTGGSAVRAGLNVKADKKFTLVVTDERGATDEASANVYFYNGVYYGVMEDGADLTSDNVNALNKKIQSGRGMTFTVDPGATQRIAYALPVAYGTPSFKDADTGFQADMYLAGTVSVVGKMFYTEDYNVWLSTNLGLGNTRITVS